MKALIIGGNGFIGSHLVDALVTLDWDVQIIDINQRRYDPPPPQAHFIQGDISNAYLLREALTGVNVVFHLAWASIHETSIQDPVADVTANLIPTLNLLNACRYAGVERVIFTSSGGTIYGPANLFPISENQATNPINSYGVLKLCVEKYLHMFKHLYGLEYVVLRPSVPYGPRQNPMARQGAVAVFLYNLSHDIPIRIWGDGSITRDFFYISDMIDALVISAKKNLSEWPVYNIAGREEISLRHLIEMAEEIVGKKAQINYLPARKFDTQKLALDTRRAQLELGWFPKTSTVDGLTKTWNWMQSIF